MLKHMKSILITGGTGFIGKNISASYLKDKYQLHVPGRAMLDCSDEESVEKYFSKNDFDVVIHAAAKPGHRNAEDTTGLLYTNSRMMQLLLRQQDKWGKLLNMGSGAIYDMRHYEPKMKESYFGTHMPVDEHGYNKYLLGKLLPSLQNVYDLRIFGLFGKYEDYAIRFISNAICKSLFHIPISLRQNRKFDYLFIDDLMPVLEYFIDNSPSEKAFNVTPDHSIALFDIATMINDIADTKVAINVAENGMGMEYSGNNTLLRKEITGLNFTPIGIAISRLYDWYRNNKNNINKQLLLTDKT